MKQQQNHRRTSSFTLLELLIVVAIIAILASIQVINLAEAQVRAKVSRAALDMRAIATALESYAVDNNDYPPNPSVPNSGLQAPKGVGVGYGITPWQLTTPVAYISLLPVDPFKTGQNVYNNHNPALIGQTTRYDYHKIIDLETWLALREAGVYVSLISLDVPTPGYGNYTAFSKYGAWVQWSPGPDGQLWDDEMDFEIPGDAGSPLRAPPFPPGGYSFDVDYDPTNGTTSFGNITRNQLMRDMAASDGSLAGADGKPGPGGSPSNSSPGGKARPGSPGFAGSPATPGGSGLPALPGDGSPAGPSSTGKPLRNEGAPKPGSTKAPGKGNDSDASRAQTIAELARKRIKDVKPAPVRRRSSRLDLTRAGGISLFMLGLLLLLLYFILRHFRNRRVVSEATQTVHITDARLRGMEDLETTKALRLAHSHVTNDGLKLLRRHKTLEMLDLWNTRITDAGLISLRAIPNLKELILTDTNISDEGLAHLQNLNSLETLVLMGTSVTDAGLMYLYGLSSLRHLNLRGTKVTPEGVEILRRKLPECEIRFAPLPVEAVAGQAEPLPPMLEEEPTNWD